MGSTPSSGNRAGKTLMAGFARDAGWALVGRLLSKVAAVIVVAGLARLLGRDDFGRYLLIVSVAGVYSFIADLGLSQAVVPLVARADVGGNPADGARTIMYAWRLMAIGGAAAVSLAVSPAGRWLVDLLGGGKDDTVTLGLALMIGVLGVVKAAQLLAGEMFRSFGDVRAASFHGELLPSIALAASIAALVAGLRNVSLMTALIVAASAPALMGAVSWVAFLRRYGSHSPATRGYLQGARHDGATSERELLQAALPLLGHRLAMYVATQADLWVAGALLGVSAVAGYGAATRLLILMDVPLVVSNLALAPRIARYLHEGRDAELQEEITRATAFVGLIGWSGLAFVVLFRGPILDLVFGSGYGAIGSQIIPILALGHAVFYWSGPSSLSLIMAGEQRLLLVISVLSAAVMAVAALVLGETLGIRGIALAAASGTALHNAITWFAVKYRLQLRTDFRLKGLREGRAVVQRWARTEDWRNPSQMQDDECS
jgi:O-antigen/teichoic acid export membrane protein